MSSLVQPHLNVLRGLASCGDMALEMIRHESKKSVNFLYAIFEIIYNVQSHSAQENLEVAAAVNGLEYLIHLLGQRRKLTGNVTNLISDYIQPNIRFNLY